MMAPGPPRTPTSVLEKRGSWLVKDRKMTEPQPERGRPTCPNALKDDARKLWRKLVPMLDAMGVLTRIDGTVLERYCVLMVKWRHNEAHPTEKSFDKGLRLNEALLKLEVQFGLTPSARARLQVLPKQEASGDEAQLFKMAK